jgi:CHASE2 domain-containing sensor protein
MHLFPFTILFFTVLVTSGAGFSALLVEKQQFNRSLLICAVSSALLLAITSSRMMAGHPLLFP